MFDTDNQRVEKFDSVGIFISEWGKNGGIPVVPYHSTEDGEFWYPQGIAVDNEDNVYVADTGNHRIQKFTSDGTFSLNWGEYGTEAGQFSSPLGIATDSSNNVYVVDWENRRVQKFSSDGTYLAEFGVSSDGDGQFIWPYGVAIDSYDNIYVVDEYKCTIQKFDSAFVFLTKWGEFGTGNGKFNSPRGIGIDGKDNVYVTELNNHRVQKFTSDGEFLSIWGEYGDGDGQFYSPCGVTFDSSDNIFVADTFNHRVQKFAPPIVPADIEINPGVFNLKSKGNYISCYIEILEDYNVYDIDQTKDITFEFDGNYVIAEESPRNIGDNDSDGNPDLMVKFNRQDVYDILPFGYVELIVKGYLVDGFYFEGEDTVYVKDVGKDHTNENDPSSEEY